MKTLAAILIGVALVIAVGSFFYENQGHDLGTNNGTAEGNDIFNVDIEDFEFSPSTLTIQQGDKVIWTNLDSATHRLEFDALDSPNIEHDETYSHVFNERGTFDYICSIHTSMKGKIIVE